jgi:Flp pilus assembly protein TadB
MATRKPTSAKKTSTSRKTAARRTTSRRTTARRTSSRRTTRSTSIRRRRPGLPTTIGSAIGMLVVTTLLEASWAIRVGLVLVVLLLGLAYLVWDHRADLASASSPGAPPAGDVPAEPAATADRLPGPTPTQGDPSHE